MVTQPSCDFFKQSSSDSGQEISRCDAAVRTVTCDTSSAHNKFYQEGCERCWSTRDNDCLIVSDSCTPHASLTNQKQASYMSEGRQSYVSSQTVLNRDLETVLRNAAVRAISCETSGSTNQRTVFNYINKSETSSSSAPILFSDPSVTSVVANNFHIQDFKARGYQRYYSILVLSRDRHHLTSNIKTIESLVSPVIDKLKMLAKKNFHEESSKHCSEKEYSFLGNSSLRNLCDIVKDDNIYEDLHTNFALILEHLDKNLKEKVVSGQVMRNSVLFDAAARTSHVVSGKAFNISSSVETVQNMKEQLGTQQFKLLLHHVLSGKSLEIISETRQLSRSVGDSLCLLLPNNAVDMKHSNYFANLVLTTRSDSDSPAVSGTRLEVGVDDDDQFLFTISSDRCLCLGLRARDCAVPRSNTNYCKYCRGLIESTILTKFCKIFKTLQTSDVVQEMLLRSYGGSLLSEARVLSHLTHNQTSEYLVKNSYTAIDNQILDFFKYFS